MPKYAFKRINWQHISFKGGWNDASSKDKSDDEIKTLIISQFTYGGIKTEKLNSNPDDMRFSFRLNKQDRVICTIAKFKGEDCLVILSVTPHKYETTSGMKASASAGVDDALIGGFIPSKDDTMDLPHVSAVQSNDGKLIVYSREQSTAVESIDHLQPQMSGVKYYIVNGLAGSGKTTIAYDVLSRAQVQGAKAIYATKSQGLVSQAKKNFNGSEAESETQGADAADASQESIQCLTGEQLISRKLFQYFAEFVQEAKKPSSPIRGKAAAPKGKSPVEEPAFSKIVQDALDLTSDDIEALQARLIELHKQGDSHLEANPDAIKISACLKAYLEKTLYRKENFVEWLKTTENRDIKKLIKELPKALSLDDLYFEIQKTHMPLGKKGTLYKDLHSCGTADKICKKYIDYLSSNKKIDPAFASYQKPGGAVPAAADSGESSSAAWKEELEYDCALPSVLVLDEAQNFSPTEIEAILAEIGDNAVVYLCRDGNQSQADPFDLTIQTMYNLTHKEPEHLFNLNTSYRTPPAITQLVNTLLNIKAHVIGGKLHSIDSGGVSAASAASSEDRFTSMAQHNGYIKWITESADPVMAGLKDVIKNIVDSVVIVFNDQDKTSAAKMFPDSLILTPKDVVGLEYKNVILYNPFVGGSLLSNDVLFRDKYKAQEPAPSHYPKDSENLKYVHSFNELFVAITRSTSNLYVVACEGGIFFHDAFAETLGEYSKGVAEATAKLSLDQLVAHIDVQKYIWSADLLYRYISHAVKLISEDQTIAPAELRPLIVTLSPIVASCGAKARALQEDITKAWAQRAAKKVAEAPSSSSSQASSQASSASSDDDTDVANPKHPHKAKKPVTPPKGAGAVSAKPVHALKQSIVDDLIKATTKSDLEKVQKIITDNPDYVNAKGAKGVTALHIAVKKDHQDMIECLLTHGADPRAITNDGNTVISCAQRTLVIDLLESIISIEDDIKLAPNNVFKQMTINCIPASLIKDIIQKRFYTRQPDSEAVDDSAGMVVPEPWDRKIVEKIMEQAKQKDTTLISVLIRQNKDYINLRNDNGMTLLHMALEEGCYELTEVLLTARANVNIPSYNGMTAFHLLCGTNQPECVLNLLKEGRVNNINAKAIQGITPLYLACEGGYIDVVKHLVSYGADITISLQSIQDYIGCSESMRQMCGTVLGQAYKLDGMLNILLNGVMESDLAPLFQFSTDTEILKMLQSRIAHNKLIPPEAKDTIYSMVRLCALEAQGSADDIRDLPQSDDMPPMGCDADS